MAYIDERTQKFIDNIINGASNEELFKMQRTPASKPFVGPPTEAQDIPVVATKNVQPEIEISAPAKRSPIEISMPALVKQTPDYISNVNASIDEVSKLNTQLKEEHQNVQERYDKSRQDLSQAYKLLGEASQPRVRTPEENARLLAAQENLKNIKDTPERDMLSEAIISFAPALLGSLTGESGALAAPTAAKQSRELYESRRKQDIESINKKNEQILKNYENILKIDKESAEAYLNNQKLKQEQAKSIFQGASTVGNLDQSEIKALRDKIVDLQKAEQSATQKGAEKVVDTETIPLKEAGKTARAGIVAKGQGLKSATDLRKEYTSLPEIKRFDIVRSSYDKILQSSKEKGGPADLSLVYAYMKMLDEGSVVRETEFKSAAEARGALSKLEGSGVTVPAFLVQAVNRMQDGSILLPEQREAFRKQAQILYNSSARQAKKTADVYKGYAAEYNTKPELVVGQDPEIIPEKTKIQKLDELLKSGRITKEQYKKFKGGQ